MATTIAPVTHNAFIKALKAVAPPELLETIVPDPEFTNAPASAAAADATASDLKYPCATQRAPGVADLVVGWGQTIPRWRKGQVVNFATLSTGYPSLEDALSVPTRGGCC